MPAIEIPGDAALHALAQRLGGVLRARGWMLATAESCTGGWIAKAITDVAGSSDWFSGGIVAYANAAKATLLDVPVDTLEKHGAVSQQTAVAMAAGALARFTADLAVAVTGIAGPGGGSIDKPVGTVWVAWLHRGYPVQTRVFRFAGAKVVTLAEVTRSSIEASPAASHLGNWQPTACERDAVRRQTVAAALDGLLGLAAIQDD